MGRCGVLSTLQWTGILCECIHRVTTVCCIVIIATQPCTHNKAADTLAVKDHLQTHKQPTTHTHLHHKTPMLEARHMRSVDSSYVVTANVMERNMSLSKTHEGAGNISEAAEQKWRGCDTQPTRKACLLLISVHASSGPSALPVWFHPAWTADYCVKKCVITHHHIVRYPTFTIMHFKVKHQVLTWCLAG